MRDFCFKVNFSQRVTYYLQLRIADCFFRSFPGIAHNSDAIRSRTRPNLKHVRDVACYTLLFLMGRKPICTLKTVCIQITAHVEKKKTLPHVLIFPASTESPFTLPFLKSYVVFITENIATFEYVCNLHDFCCNHVLKTRNKIISKIITYPENLIATGTNNFS